MITTDFLTAVMPNLQNNDQWADALNKTLTQYEINTTNRITMFLAQCMYESTYFTKLAEDLNYSAEALLRVFPRYFNADEAAEYARQPEKIASRVYANRMGNGDEASGDGWTYAGKGLIMVTGKYSYNLFATNLSMQISDAVTYCTTIEGAAMVAGWFWNNNHLNELADQDEFTEITKRINGGLNGLADRKTIWTRVQNAYGN